MKIKVTFVEAHHRWREEVEAMIAEIKTKKATNKSHTAMQNMRADAWDWSYNYCVSFTGGSSFADLVKNAERAQRGDRPATLQERLDSVISRASGTLQAKFKRKTTYRNVAVPKDLLVAYYKPIYEREIAEEARIATLTPEQLEAETKQLLGQLELNPGFMYIRIPRP